MTTNSNNRALVVSQKAYDWLLLAYPPTHREKYGAAMAQLFRDQCRDAWNESQGWGLVKLWLRVLPDLVKTSIIERFATINKRKSMSDKMTALIQPRRVFSRVFVVVFLLVLAYSVAVAFLLPETYASTARIKVENDSPSTGYAPYFIQTQFEIMESQIVLQSVIDKLNLNVEWGRKYFAGETLQTSKTLEILKQRLQLAPVQNTKLISITAYSDDGKEAARLANAIAESYRDYRIKSRNELAAKKIEALPPGQEKQAAQLEAQIPKTTMVQFTDRAEPGRAPVRPNKTLNIVLGVVLGILSASVLGTVAAFIASRINKRKQKLNAMA